jgi:hypothetical protein
VAIATPPEPRRLSALRSLPGRIAALVTRLTPSRPQHAPHEGARRKPGGGRSPESKSLEPSVFGLQAPWSGSSGEHKYIELAPEDLVELLLAKPSPGSAAKVPAVSALPVPVPVPVAVPLAVTVPAPPGLTTPGPEEALAGTSARPLLEASRARLMQDSLALRAAECTPEDAAALIDRINETRHTILAAMSASPEKRDAVDAQLRDVSRHANAIFLMRLTRCFDELRMLDGQLGRPGLAREAITRIALKAGAALVEASAVGQQIDSLMTRLNDSTAHYDRMYAHLNGQLTPAGLRRKQKLFATFNRIEETLLDAVRSDTHAAAVDQLTRVGAETCRRHAQEVQRLCENISGSALRVTRAPPAGPYLKAQLRLTAERQVRVLRLIDGWLDRTRTMVACRAAIHETAGLRPLTHIQQGALDYLGLQIRYHEEQIRDARQTLAGALACFIGNMPRTFEARLERLRQDRSQAPKGLKLPPTAETTAGRTALDDTRSAIQARVGHAQAWVTALKAVGGDLPQGTSADLARLIERVRIQLAFSVAVAQRDRTGPVR